MAALLLEKSFGLLLVVPYCCSAFYDRSRGDPTQFFHRKYHDWSCWSRCGLSVCRSRRVFCPCRRLGLLSAYQENADWRAVWIACWTAFGSVQRLRWGYRILDDVAMTPTPPNFSLHWTGSSRFSLLQWRCRWRLLPASELRRWAH